jgi:hypothetical protein
MLGNDKFLASPPPRKDGPKQVAKRTVLQDLSNASASVASWWHGAGKKDAKKATQNDADNKDIESPPSKPEAKDLYVNLGDDGVSPTRNALWNDDNAC